MNTQQAYDIWALQYDHNVNATRDLEAIALRTVLEDISDAAILEIGCGTGKNSEWLITKAKRLLAVDLSEQMLTRARAKLPAVNFIQADITQPWNFTLEQFDCIVFSLVLEHIQNLVPVFTAAANKLQPGGIIYIGELHPFKQYAGSKARFETAEGTTILDCYTHHITDFIDQAKQAGLALTGMQEWFDEDDRSSVPRILTLLLHKPVQ